MYDTLTVQLAQCRHSVMIGGGYKYFLPENRKDGLSPLDTLAKRGYSVVRTLDSALSFTGDRLVGLIYDGKPLPEPERGDVLRPASMKAIEMLSRNPKGFTMMIEGSQIDWACHDNDSAYLRAELADFELMLHAVLDWAEKDGNTLVVVTADHETGGLTMIDPQGHYSNVSFHYSTHSHTCLPVMIYAYGPGAEQFTGWMQNNEVKAKILKACGIETQAKAEVVDQEIAPIKGSFDSNREN